jgi:hypothetical protein
MTFRPSPGDELAIGDQIYHIAEHPAAPGMAYGQAGRRGTVYQLLDAEGEAWALKVFQRKYREPRLAGQAERIRDFAAYPGLRACNRNVLTSTQYDDLIRDHIELAYAVLMPWIPGKTWMEVIVGEEVLSPEESLGIVRSLLHVLAKMEERGMAHCDLSGPNLILTPEGEIELVDLEEMYAPGLIQPKALPGGSPGYAHKTAPEGLWCDEADRFAGAVMVCEMLGWSDGQVRQGAWGEGYFKPEEMQTHCDRFQILKSVLSERWGDRMASLFKVAWFSDTLLLCPTFTEWLAVLPKEVPKETVQGAIKTEAEKPILSEPYVEDIEKSVAEEIEPSKDEALEELDWIEEPVELGLDETRADGEFWECSQCGQRVRIEFGVCPYCEKGLKSIYRREIERERVDHQKDLHLLDESQNQYDSLSKSEVLTRDEAPLTERADSITASTLQKINSIKKLPFWTGVITVGTILIVLGVFFIYMLSKMNEMQESEYELFATYAVETVSASPTLTAIETKSVLENTAEASPNTQSQPSQTFTPTPTRFIPASMTPSLPTETIGACVDSAVFEADVTVPDDTRMDPGQSFTKTWRLKNSGTCTWTSAYSVVFNSGNSMGGPTSTSLLVSVPPGGTVDISIDLTAPLTSGIHRADWLLRNAEGAFFGIGSEGDSPFYVQIIVDTTPTP